MPIIDQFIQEPSPGKRMLAFRGDAVAFRLTLDHPRQGCAFLRTNIGRAEIRRKEIIRAVHEDEPPLGGDWFDVPMTRLNATRFKVVLPLCEVGHFEAKAFFLPEAERDPIWPPGSNTVLNVAPADTCCGNVVYNAFVRQFGPNKRGDFNDPNRSGPIEALDTAGYAVIPPSGTFRDLIRELDFIVNRLGCRIIQLLPIHPTPTTYGRLGRFGSPYAALSFTAVDPALAEFDPKATPLEQFLELVDAVHAHHAKLFIDIAINHTGWAAGLHESHPQWLARSPEGRIEVPGAWGVRWEDLAKLDYSCKDLWQHMAGVFLTWRRRGVDGFRCDAGYMIPVRVWEYLIARVREQFPDTVFFLEGLGGKLSATRDLLNIANFNWAYSELFQNYDRGQIEHYLPEAIEISNTDGLMFHYAETHDNPRLAARSRTYARMRTALCALCSQHGAFGFANGVEWCATEKIDVHESPSLNWGSDINQVAEIARLNTILKTHPAFYDQTRLDLIQRDHGNFIVLRRLHEPTGKALVVAANLDDRLPATAKWALAEAPAEKTRCWDLLTESEAPVGLSGGLNTLDLAPGQVCCLTTDVEDVALIRNATAPASGLPPRVAEQLFRSKVMDVYRHYKGMVDLDDFDIDNAVDRFKADPIGFCRLSNPRSEESRVVTWNWPQDLGREVMIPPEHFLMVRAEQPFRASLVADGRVVRCENSLPTLDGVHFALFSPLPIPEAATPVTLSLSLHASGARRHEEAPILLLCRARNATLRTACSRKELIDNAYSILGTNGTGGMMMLPLKWGELSSRYDALLSANCDPTTPTDRWIMFTRCRLWCVFQGYSREIDGDCVESFVLDEDQKGTWCFRVPTGRGKFIRVAVRPEILPEKNSLTIRITRVPTGDNPSGLPDVDPVRIIMRPDIESRNAHYATKAYQGPEGRWPGAVRVLEHGFRFHPEPDRLLAIGVSRGDFVHEPEWLYMVHRPREAERGFDPDSDLFSPGYFSVFLRGGEQVILTAETCGQGMEPAALSDGDCRCDPPGAPGDDGAPGLIKTLERSLNHYLARRGKFKTVIAGYPWFLDWGRDSLIVSRGLIAAEDFDSAKAVITLFAQFERDGTLPNMIQGDNTRNRDTSDAPLWLVTACRDLAAGLGSQAFLDESIGGRSLRRILISIGHNLIKGTPNGIRMDPESGLLYSPVHFTWMDTNHPACTPREGYPVEIQALWFAALGFLSEIDDPKGAETWKRLAEEVRSSVKAFFYLRNDGYLSDCLYARKGAPASHAEPDDALRPNQLLAVTLGAVDEPDICRGVLLSCEELLVPGAIRSLANRRVSRPLEIVHDGRKLVDPHHPYQGRYLGDEDSRRKPAYHNGTAWTWLHPSFCEAWGKVYGDQGRETALAYLAAGVKLINEGCIGHLPEILDGDFPHTQRGCDAQAWGISEFVRVWKILEKGQPL